MNTEIISASERGSNQPNAQNFDRCHPASRPSPGINRHFSTKSKLIKPLREATQHALAAAPAAPSVLRSPRRTQPVLRPVSTVQDKPLKITVPHLSSQPVMVGDRQTLRALRAAEMAAWEAASSHTNISSTNASEEIGIPSRLPVPTPRRAEDVLYAILGVSATLALWVGGQDLEALVAGWSQFAVAIRVLIH